MSIIYKNITGNTATDLNVLREIEYTYSSMSLCNSHASDSVNVDLYLYRNTSSDDDKRRVIGEDGNWNEIERVDVIYYILKAVKLPIGATLLLDESSLSFDNLYYQLYIKLSASDSAVDIILK
tara:strand:+ start:512 stop:880 length:369 start_codon:yes stop_codon:yes gene_type:complete